MPLSFSLFLASFFFLFYPSALKVKFWLALPQERREESSCSPNHLLCFLFLGASEREVCLSPLLCAPNFYAEQHLETEKFFIQMHLEKSKNKDPIKASQSDLTTSHFCVATTTTNAPSEATYTHVSLLLAFLPPGGFP